MGILNMERWDKKVIRVAREHRYDVARFALFLVFFWFGILKVIGLSPANPIVVALLGRTMSFWPSENFLVVFGLFECLIGISFLFKGLLRFVVPLVAVHLLTTVLPLVLLPDLAWSTPFVPTLEGQYILKNVLILATVFALVGHMKPMKR